MRTDSVVNLVKRKIHLLSIFPSIIVCTYWNFFLETHKGVTYRFWRRKGSALLRERDYNEGNIMKLVPEAIPINRLLLIEYPSKPYELRLDDQYVPIC